jgi:DNA-binding SARP family transcriptional activator
VDGEATEVQLLGRVEARIEGRAIETPGTKQLGLLALLALEAGRTVTVDQVVDGIWGERLPQTIKVGVRVHVSRLRKSLDAAGVPGLIVTRPGGYALDAPATAVDVHRFAAAARAARDAAATGSDEALGLARTALRCWTGAPLVGLEEIPFAPARIAGLVGQWLDVVELTADLELATGDPSRMLPELHRLVAAHPFRESLASRLATTLYRLGHHADALAVLRVVRRSLADELGLDPSPPLRALEHAILVHDPGLGAVAAAPPPSRRITSPVADGADAVSSSPTAPSTRVRIPRPALATQIARAAHAGAVLVHGEAGAGKSTIVADVVDALRADGVTAVTVVVTSSPARPMEPIAQLVEALALAVPAPWHEHGAAHPRTAAAVGHLLGRAPAATLAPTSREALVDELVAAISGTVVAAGGWLVVEDCHWLDRTSADVIAGCVAAGCRAVLTSRRPLDPSVTALAALPVIEVPPFDLAEVADALATALPDRASPTLAAELRARTGGNPLFLMLLLDVLDDHDGGAATVDDVANGATLRATVQERTAGLSRTTREVLQLAGLLGVSFPVELVQRIRPHALTALREAADEGLLRLDGDGHATFLHGLIAEAMTDDVPRGLLVAWHDELCRVLTSVEAAPAAVAAQALGAVDLDPHRATRACLAAASADALVFEWRAAVDWARRGLDVVARFATGGDVDEARLQELVGTGLRRTSQAGSDIALLRAAQLGREVGALDVVAGAVIELCLHGPTTQAGTIDERALRELDAALTLDLPAARRAELLAAGATLMTVSDRAEQARSLYLEAAATAERAGDPATLRSVHLNAHLGLSHPADLARRRAAAAALATCGDAEARWEAQFLRFGLCLIDADRSGVDAALADLRRLTPEVRQRERERGLLQVEAVHAHLTGDLVAAEQLAERALTACLEAFSESWSMSIYATLIFPVREVQGRLGELVGAVTALASESPDFVTWRALTACVAGAAEDRELVGRELAALTASGFTLAEDLTWTAVATMLCRPILWMRDVAAATVLAPQLAPYAGQMSWNGLSTHGPVDAGLACLADVLGDGERRAIHLAAARDLLDRCGAPHLWWPELNRLS